MSLNIGELVAYISVNTSKGESAVSGFTSRMKSAGDSVASRFQSIGKSVSGVGDNIYGVGKKMTKGITAPVGIAVGAVGGLTAALGWGRLKSIDTAQAQLKGLGYSTEDVDRITGQLTTALEGGMMTMGDATSAAASGMASGVKEGKELTRYIQVLDGAVAGSNGTFEEMNMIFARVQGNGKLMTGELQMVEQRMPGFTATMAKSFGVTQEEMQKMVSEGKVSSDDFMDVMEDFAGGMATEYAKSWEGMVENTKNYIGIIGEQMLSGVFEQSKDSIAEFIEWLKSPEVEAFAQRAGAAIGSAFSTILTAVKSVITWFAGLPAPIQKASLVIAGIAVAAGPVLMIVGKLITVFGGMISTIGTVIGWLTKLGPVFAIVKTGIMLVSGAMKALWLTMMANPIILIIAAIAAIVAALIWFFTQTETGKAIWQGFMDWLGTAWEWIKTTAVTVFNAVVDAITTAWEWVKSASMAVWNAIKATIGAIWKGIVFYFKNLNPVGFIITHWDQIKAGTKAAWDWVVNKIKDVWNTVVTWIKTNVNKVKTFITDGWNKIKSTTANLWNGIKTWLLNLLVKVVTGIVQKVNQIKSRIRDTWNAIKSTTANIWNAVKTAIIRTLVRMVSGAIQKFNQIRSKIRDAWNTVKRVTKDAWHSVKNAVIDGVDNAIRFVRELPGRALDALGNVGSKLYDAGWSLIDGFKNGIVNAFNNAVDAVRNGLNRVRNFFPFSPAKEGPFSGHGYTLYSGMALAGDFAKGMSMAEADVVRQAEAITKAAAFDVPDVPGMSGPSMSAGQSSSQSPSGVTNNFNIVNPVAEPTSETARKASAYIGVSV